MEIEKVKLDKDGGFIVNDSILVPNDLNNRHYHEIYRWSENGGEIEPFETNNEILIREAKETDDLILKELDLIDKKSIREIREWIASQPNAPKYLKDKDQEAINARKKLSKNKKDK